MQKIAKFEKVSENNFIKAYIDFIKEYNLDEYKKEENHLIDVAKDLYNKIKLPKRATMGSAGYDFFLPFDLKLKTLESIKIPTGIRCKMQEGWVLKEYPRSSYGFKYGVHMANTIGIIDSDYYYADNEGHIFIKLINDSLIAEDIEFKIGSAFCQGLFIPFGITEDDNTTDKRIGGLGSTGR